MGRRSGNDNFLFLPLLLLCLLLFSFSSVLPGPSSPTLEFCSSGIVFGARRILRPPTIHYGRILVLHSLHARARAIRGSGMRQQSRCMRLTAIDQCEGGRFIERNEAPRFVPLMRDPCSWTGRPALNMKPRDRTKYEPKKQAYLRAHPVIRGKRRDGRGKGEK